MSSVINLFRIFSRVVNSQFLNIEDYLDNGKLRLFVGHIGNGGMNGNASFYLDLPTPNLDQRNGDYSVLPVLDDLANGNFVDFRVQKGYEYAGNLIFKSLRINSKGNTVYVSVSVYPGKRQGQVVVPATEQPNYETNMGMTQMEARAMAHTVLLYINARFTQMIMQGAVTSPPKVNGHSAPSIVPNHTNDSDDKIQLFVTQLWGKPIA